MATSRPALVNNNSLAMWPSSRRVGMRPHCLILVTDFQAGRNAILSIARIVSNVSNALPCRIYVAEKGAGCPPTIPHVVCAKWPNVGREFGTVLQYVARMYDQLPNVLINMPATALGHGRRSSRLAWLERALREVDPDPCGTFTCMWGRDELVRTSSSFQVSRYSQGALLSLASPRPLGAWLAANANLTEGIGFPWCWGGTFRTTRERLHVWPRSFYRRLAALVNIPDPEAGHYAERAARWLFGGSLTCGNSLDSLEFQYAMSCWSLASEQMSAGASEAVEPSEEEP